VASPSTSCSRRTGAHRRIRDRARRPHGPRSAARGDRPPLRARPWPGLRTGLIDRILDDGRRGARATVACSNHSWPSCGSCAKRSAHRWGLPVRRRCGWCSGPARGAGRRVSRRPGRGPRPPPQAVLPAAVPAADGRFVRRSFPMPCCRRPAWTRGQAGRRPPGCDLRRQRHKRRRGRARASVAHRALARLRDWLTTDRDFPGLAIGS